MTTPCMFGADWYRSKETADTEDINTGSSQWDLEESDLVLGKPIGSGSFADVFEASLKTKKGPSQKVAAKRLYSQMCTADSMKEVKEDHQKELDFQCKLKHKNIITFIGVILTKTTMIFVSELAAKGSLFDFLRRPNHHPLSEKRLLRWMLQAACSIQYLHRKNVVHRDIKSLNYLVADDNTLKLCDFGIAKSITRTVDTIQKGSFPWMAPEVFIEQKVSHKSDIYSYGVVIWELKTGKIPFGKMDGAAIMWAVGNGKRPPIPGDCTQPIRNLLRQCWEGDRRNRPHIDSIVSDVKGMLNLLRLETSVCLG
ncbi:uncharacterized protein [Amphiura filiformis]|uniref:uncharacterized protein n=1 Tax=Amphiura filiformis TaxID=82378 RepID=UPI003B2224DF